MSQSSPPTSDGGAEDGGASPSRRRRSSMFGLKSASSFGDVALEMSMAELARMLGASTVLVFLITFIAAVILSAGGVFGYGLLYGGCRGFACTSTFMLSFDEQIHPSWLRPGSATFFAAWAFTVLVLGGSLGSYDALYDADASGWQAGAICAYFVYFMTFVAISTVIFQGHHRDESRQMVYCNAAIFLGIFVNNMGKASPVDAISTCGAAIYLSSIIIYLPITIIKLHKHLGKKEVGRSYAAMMGIIIGGTMPVQLQIATLRKCARACVPANAPAGAKVSPPSARAARALAQLFRAIAAASSRDGCRAIAGESAA